MLHIRYASFAKLLACGILAVLILAGCGTKPTDPTETTAPESLSGTALLEALNTALAEAPEDKTGLDVLEQMGYAPVDLRTEDQNQLVIYHPSTRQFLLLDKTNVKTPTIVFPEGIAWEDLGEIMSVKMKTMEKASILYNKYVCIGDSLSYGDGSSAGNRSWCNLIAERMDAQLYKLAVSGESVWEHMRQQVEQVPEDADLVTVLMGTNDSGLLAAKKFPLGDVDAVLAMENDSPEDYENSQLFNDSLIGRYRWCLEALQRKAPNARIIVVTPLPYNNERYTAQIVEAEKALCLAMGVEVIVPTESPIFEVEAFKKLQVDNLHPNDEGYQVVADFVFEYIENTL
ncbi:MAG: SGNH/GDSL hydrolase family protein [Oscillospiraceae bacterium]|nr:SGNH/GDSL hydrolase family protein [Oscillospiraceae bacterium]